MTLLIVKNFDGKEYVHGVEVKTQDDCDNAFKLAFDALRTGKDLTLNFLNQVAWKRCGESFDGVDDVEVLAV